MTTQQSPTRLSLKCFWAGIMLMSVVAFGQAPSLFIEGYFDQLSYRPGETARLHVSTSADDYAISITRLGARPILVVQLACRVLHPVLLLYAYVVFLFNVLILTRLSASVFSAPAQEKYQRENHNYCIGCAEQNPRDLLVLARFVKLLFLRSDGTECDNDEHYVDRRYHVGNHVALVVLTCH